MTDMPIVVVVGSLHYDIMVDAPHLPRKGETVTGYSWRPKFGGKGGNQAVAAAKAGAQVRFSGAVGDDDFGRFLLTALEQGNVDISKVARLADTASGMSVGSGVVGLKRGEALVSLPALPVKLVSTHGAGDVFVGTLAAGLATGLSFSASVGAANHAAARHVSEMPQSPE